MKVIILSQRSSKDNYATGEVYLERLNDVLKSEGHDSKIITIENVQNALNKKINGEYRYSTIDKIFLFKEYLKIYEELFNPDVIVSLDFCSAMSDTRAPTIVFAGTNYNDVGKYLVDNKFIGDIDSYENIVFMNMEKDDMKKSYNIVVPSKEMQKYIERLGFNSEIISPPVDTEKYKSCKDKTSLRKKYGIPEDKVVGITNTVFHPTKKFEIQSRLCNEFRDIFWIIAIPHDVDYREKLGNVKIIKSDDNINELYSLSDFYISTSKIESCNIQAIEAASCNIPVIAFKTGWFFDCFGGEITEIGYIVTIDEYEEFKKAVIDVVNNLNSDKFKPREVIVDTEKIGIKRFADEWKTIINHAIKLDKTCSDKI